MNPPRRSRRTRPLDGRWQIPAAIATLALLAGCGNSDPQADPTTVPSAPATTTTTTATTTTRADGKPANPLLDDPKAILVIPADMSPTVHAAAEGYARAEQAYVRALNPPVTTLSKEIDATTAGEAARERQLNVLKVHNSGEAFREPTMMRLTLEHDNMIEFGPEKVQLAACYTVSEARISEATGEVVSGPKITSTRVYTLMELKDGTWKMTRTAQQKNGNWEADQCGQP